MLGCFSFVGICGLHHFYLGRPIKGLIWLFTIGLLGVGIVWDLFTIPGEKRRAG
jgi:TM2 domain-containing membrane protein YozV